MRGFLTISTLLSGAASAAVRFTNSTDSHDYVIVGGGTSGLALANRLSENPAVSVLVIEAGGSVFDNVNVTNPNGYGLAFGTDIDFAFQTTNQTYGGGQVLTMRAAKALGGTSTINGLAYTRAESSQVDAWEKLGNEGWNWNALFPYYLKSEHFQTPEPARQVAGHLEYESKDHGENGPLLTGWTFGQTNGTIPAVLNSTYKNLGLPWNEDVNGGNMVGFSVFPRTVDQENAVREDAARAYYYPYQNRTNLQVLLNTSAQKLTWKNATVPTADGVEVVSADGSSRIVKARKDVILSAGSLHGIETVVNLPTVGENLQDQMNNGLSFAMKNITVDGAITTVAYPSAEQMFDNVDEIAAQVKESLPAYAATVASVNGNVTQAADLLEFFEMQWSLIFESKIPIAEVLVNAAQGTWSSEYWGLLPFSRGSIHISETSTANAIINPNYFLLDWDLLHQVQTAKFIRKLYGTAPFSTYAGTETRPGVDVVAEDADIEGWTGYIKGNYRSNFHPVGTAAMMPREKGGVVDANLKVYGTTNVRVVDASVLPFQVCGHLVSTLYAVAERAADLILEN
ncbi:GMC oxidoreductase [Colletotrichum graminicola M1.001]|uniref:Amine oxidase n=1 Tax=Colletotrichum graminicola (strain M1.001 / M2 / FGSC 10212) TaxID=645133 RepID=E3QQA4_COLGM|nr:GMC oxidoreductase [Colletotrichum graminicola M1.001]EFQ33042.1 GMC oxidoreductase [Colletotrichum graminicola M1.001]